MPRKTKNKKKHALKPLYIFFVEIFFSQKFYYRLYPFSYAPWPDWLHRNRKKEKEKRDLL